MLRELISENEYEMMSNYRREYSGGRYSNSEPSISIFDYLSTWELNKADLFHMLGNNLIIRKPFSYQKAPIEMMEQFECKDIYDKVISRGFLSQLTTLLIYRKKTYVSKEFHPYCDYLLTHYSTNEINKLQPIHKVWSSESLFYGNGYQGPDIELPLMNGKKLKICKGMKPMRIIRKLYEAFNQSMQEFNEFNMAYSLVLNDAKVEGILNLSIHPFDFWTMSHNTYGWTSCMDWTDNGCYRRGTLSMMESRNIVMAYITSSDSSGLYLGDNHYWSDKKWRQLFIVDNDMGVISSIKAYPYFNPNITKEVMNWLKDLYKEANPEQVFKSEEPKELTNGKDNLKFSYKDKIFRLHFNCHPMYCDMGCDLIHYLLTTSRLDEIAEEKLKVCPDYGTPNITINYGSEVRCLWCGSYDSYYDSEEALVCEECYSEKECCAYCSERIYPDDNFFDEHIGGYVCEYCLNEHYCITLPYLCYEPKEKVTPIYIVNYVTEQFFEKDVIGTKIGYFVDLEEFKSFYLSEDKEIYYDEASASYYVNYNDFKPKRKICAWDLKTPDESNKIFFDFSKKI